MTRLGQLQLITPISAFSVGCGIVSPRYVNYKAGLDDIENTGAAITVCDEAEISISNVFTTAGCSCHTTTQPNVSSSSRENREAFYRIATTEYNGDFAALATYLKTDHAGSDTVSGDVALELDNWVTLEGTTCVTTN
ncbi:MAG: hypothetical protein HRU19_21275 [Pseudobacteriovorax sp.]|nr:hypothetical protein [Gammaproteobacteria bacterium]NRA67034.1 hypothetical protein [Pseudobacteriovorax sp.]